MRGSLLCYTLAKAPLWLVSSSKDNSPKQETVALFDYLANVSGGGSYLLHPISLLPVVNKRHNDLDALLSHLVQNEVDCLEHLLVVLPCTASHGCVNSGHLTPLRGSLWSKTGSRYARPCGIILWGRAAP